MDEGTAFQRRYQNKGYVQHKICNTILQGTGVGGTTTINWTSCFRTPDRILNLWQERFGSKLTSDMLRPHFEVEELISKSGKHYSIQTMKRSIEEHKKGWKPKHSVEM